MSKTTEELAARALNSIGVTGTGQSPTPEDMQAVLDVLPSVFNSLQLRGVWRVDDDRQIDDAAFLHLADCVANAVGPDFGMPQDEAKRLLAEMRLRQLSTIDNIDVPIRGLYF